MKRRYNMPCPECSETGTEIRRIDTKRQCPWSIIGHMGCSNGHTWATYLKPDESRITPFDFEEEEQPKRRERRVRDRNLLPKVQ